MWNEETTPPCHVRLPQPILHSAFLLLPFLMSDLKFAFRQLLKNPGFAAVAVLTLGSGGRIPCGCRSKSRSSRRHDAGPLRGNPVLPERTRLWNCPAVARDAGRDAPDLRGICGSLHARPAGCAASGFDRGSKTLPTPWTSRVALKLIVRRFPELLRVFFALGLHFIQQLFQRGTRTRVVNDPLPLRVAIQFRHQGGQVFRQPLPVRGRQRTDGRLNILNCAHVGTIPRRPWSDKSRVCPVLIQKITGHWSLTTDCSLSPFNSAPAQLS